MTELSNDFKIEELSKTITENVFDILRKNGFEIKEKKNTFQRTEQLLYLIPQLKEAIKHNNQKIKDLDEYGIVKKAKVVHIVTDANNLKKDEDELINQEISKLKQRNYIINSQIKWVNGIILKFKNDKFYKIIELKYFKNMTHEQIAEHFECEPRTISRNKTKLINSMKSLLFPNDSISELGI